MTASRPSPIKDIRYFEAAELPQHGHYFPSYTGQIYQLPKEATRLGQRIACKCNEHSISIGASSHLYLLFTPALPNNEVQILTYQAEKWHVFVAYGINPDQLNIDEQKQIEFVEKATFACLQKLAPKATEKLSQIQNLHNEHGDKLKISCLEKHTKKYIINILHTVSSDSVLFLEVMELESNRTKTVQLSKLRFYDEAYFLAGSVSIVANIITVAPRKSFRAELYTKEYKTPFKVSINELFAT